MARSKNKLVYVHRSLFPKFFYNPKKKMSRKHLYKCIVEKNSKIGPYYFFWNRATVINKKLLNKRIALYNGYVFHIISITEDHEGFKLGEFSTSRRTVKHAGKQRQIKRREKKSVRQYVIDKYYPAPNMKKQGKTSNRQKVRDSKKEK